MNELEIFRRTLEHELGTDTVMLDVGGHHGSSSMPFAELGVRIFVFEPDPENREVLLRSADKYQNITVDSRAVTNRDSQDLDWFQSPESSGVSGLSPFLKTHARRTAVRTVTLDTYSREQGLTSIDILKIDTEGHDLHVLQGHNWSDQGLSPRVILCEFEDAKTVGLGYRWNEMAEFLVSKSYEVLVSEWYPIVRYGAQHQWRRFQEFPCELESENAWGNLLAFRDHEDFKQAQRIADECAHEYRRGRVPWRRAIHGIAARFWGFAQPLTNLLSARTST